MQERPETQAVHAGREDLEELGVHALPIDLSSTYRVFDLEAASRSLTALSEGALPVGGEMIYARLYNPTVARFEKGLAALEGTEEAVAFASGMAAITASLLAARSRGDEVVAVRPLYGGTDHLRAREMLGLTGRWCEATKVHRCINDRTALVLMETPGNPTLQLIDIEDVVRRAGGVPVLVDNTFATPILQRPRDFGAALVLHSATKFLGGHGDVVGGVVATNAEWAAALRRVRVATGGILHPLAAYLLHRGLPTLPLRVEAEQRGAMLLAERLAAHELVQTVRYPGLKTEDRGGIVQKQMRGPGSLLAFEVVGGFEAAAAIMSELRIITPAVSLGSVDTLMQHPAGLTHKVVDENARQSTGITPSLLRISVGLENPEDLWEDLRGALLRAHRRVESVHHLN